ncbi:lytic transglycosylase domain-containing protein [Phyllobacterium sp. 21LDTY02-6]|uniref:lytic transglycosylase domain-containing protein n=1 Tax=Phyllobacterium sp. 21LDTY02-6 TaxID=2944903 RepID=UPI0020205735|nr:lytic transglycosylase domain-containing protein [Phyllobacterium sp. 21LDTY02-6]MCO4317968.1 lytic transglycosylase domain-containing protein [Phyllobacterium sp. 21LDTY02-6]
MNFCRHIFSLIPICALFVAGIAAAEPARPEIKVTVMPEAPLPEPATGKPCRFDPNDDAAQGRAVIEKIAAEEGFDKDLLLAIARRESGFRMNSVSSAGAIGLMQLMPETAKRFSVDPCDPEDNVRGAVRYLRVLQQKYDNPIYVLAAYNAGEAAVAKNNGVPLYPETVAYVSAVLTDLYGWKPLQARRSENKPATIDFQQPRGAREWSQGFVLHME